ncbi:MAG TPA: hypothetical protein VIL60_10400 [Rhodanobacter sp.]
MQNSDILVVAIIETALVLFASSACLRDAHIRRRKRTAEATAEVTRDDKSMNALYTAYGASIVSSLVLITNAAGLEGHKVILIVIPFVCLTYLFYFSTWFRNAIFFPIAWRLRKD